MPRTEVGDDAVYAANARVARGRARQCLQPTRPVAAPLVSSPDGSQWIPLEATDAVVMLGGAQTASLTGPPGPASGTSSVSMRMPSRAPTCSSGSGVSWTIGRPTSTKNARGEPAAPMTPFSAQGATC